MKCICCGHDLKSTKEEFTGTDNYNGGQYIKFFFCPNVDCIRYLLYCRHSVGSNR